MVLTKLSEVRLKKGMTQLQLAESVLLSERTIINLEGGGSTTENNAKRLALILKVKVSELI